MQHLAQIVGSWGKLGPVCILQLTFFCQPKIVLCSLRWNFPFTELTDKICKGYNKGLLPNDVQ